MIALLDYNEKNFKSEGELFNIITDAMHQNGIKYIPIVKGYNLNGNKKTIVDLGLEMIDSECVTEPIIMNLPNKYLDELNIDKLHSFYKKASKSDKMFIILKPLAKDITLRVLSSFSWSVMIMDSNNIIFANMKSKVSELVKSCLMLTIDGDNIEVKSPVLEDIKKYIIDNEISNEKDCVPLKIVINGEEI